ncbi:MAG: S9 family peptidase [Candidatus Bathyarchaeia archaeon]
MDERIALYGSWSSPVTSDMVASGVMRLGQVELENGDIYWCEMRPSEDGRYVIVKQGHEGYTIDVNPPPFNARTRVHEYGGGAYKPINDKVYFVNFTDQRLYVAQQNSEPRAVTPEALLRYADLEYDEVHHRILCVREDHRRDGEPENTISSISLNGGESDVLLSGRDFYSSPRISPDEAHLVWLSWDHPNMPWDGTELWIGRLTEEGEVEDHKLIAGGSHESIVQPQWSPSSDLYFISDRSNWWNLYRWSGGEAKPILRRDAEFAAPHWVFAQSNYSFESSISVICSFTEEGVWKLARLNTETGLLEEIGTPYTHISSLKASDRYAVFIGGSPSQAPSIVMLDLHNGETTVLRRSSDISVERGYISEPQPIEFPTENGKNAHAIFYKPENKDYKSPKGELPPLLVFTHGGPTGATSTTLSWSIQYWTSRGFAVVDVNYGGSTGYGREYRERLKGRWGVVDVDDCVNAANYLVERGQADGDRLAIRGGSAGGYTTLNALTFRDKFKAGASYYGLSDLEVFVGDTHKFESRYLDSLIGPYPESKEKYHDRSAINYLDQIDAPMILFQGLEDEIVPPNQAELIVEALKEKGLPVAYLPFEGEQHGFRKAENIKRSLEAELYFYSRIFNFKPADEIEPVEIENL